MKASICQKHKIRKELEEQVEEFIENGGQIQELEYGERSMKLEDIPVSRYFIEGESNGRGF